MKDNAVIEVRDESPLRWPKDWPRTLVDNRESNKQWKKQYSFYRGKVAEELNKIEKISSATITRNPLELESRDPAIAIWFSIASDPDFSWQKGLYIDNPTPTAEEIDRQFKRLASPHHPDTVAGEERNGGTARGDVKIYYKLDEYRKAALASISGKRQEDSCIPFDQYTDARMNLAAAWKAMELFRALKRLGMPTIVNRIWTQSMKAQLPERATVSHV